MQTLVGSQEIPVVYSAHHASHDFGEFSDRVALTEEQRVRFSDYGTAETVALNGLNTLIAGRSRALGDLNRNPDDPGRFQTQDYHKPDRHDIWLPGQELTDEEKMYCQEFFYNPYHNKILELLSLQDRPTFVVAWDNTAHYVVGQNDAKEDVVMPPFVLSNRGREESADPLEGERSSCDPAFMLLLKEYFEENLDARGLPTEVHLNLVMKGGYITRRYSTDRNQAELAEHGVTAHVQSLQVEYDTAITHDQVTLAFDASKAALLKDAFSVAMEQAYSVYEKAV